MTRLDSPLHRTDSRPTMETHSRSTSRRASVSQHTESRKQRDQSSSRAIFKRANRFLSHDREPQDGSSSPPVRYYERGHPLPSNCSPERKATIPFRNPDLGLPSFRRRCDAFSNEALSGLSPQRHMSYSNFRRADSQSRASPRSGSPRSTNLSPQRQTESRSSSHRRGSTSHRHGMSHVSSRQPSGKCSPSRRRDSVVSHTHSPSRSSTSNKYAESSGHSHKRSPSQSSYGHSLDSEKLYRNLKSIASSAESDGSQQERTSWSKRSKSKMESDGRYYENGRSSRNSACNSRRSGRNMGCNSRDFSPPGSDYDNRSQYSQKENGRMSGYNSRNSARNTGRNSRDSSPPHRDYEKNGHSSPRDKKQSKHRSDNGRTSSKSSMSDRHSRTDLSQSQGSWRGSHHSPLSPDSPESSRNISPASPKQVLSKTCLSPSSVPVTTETDQPNTERSRSTIRRGLEALIFSENTRSTSQPPVPEMTIEDYVVIADIPKVNFYPEEEEAVIVRRRPQSRSPRRDNQQSYREGRDSHGEYGDPEERGRGRERGRDRRERERRRYDKDTGGSSETNSTVSGPIQRSREEHKASNRKPCDQPQMQLDPLDFKKGWMFMLDDTAEWRKFWFVLDSSGLKYYTDPGSEERDEPDGEIDVRRCVRVMEFEADKNYGLQIHTQDGEITLSAMTSRIRRNWIDILQRHIRPKGSHNIAPHNSDCDKENSPSHPDHHDSESEITSPMQDEVDMMSSPLTNHREAGVGRDKEQEKRLEDRTKWFQDGVLDRDCESPWDKVQLKKGSVASVAHMMPQISETLIGTDIEKKWEDFEKIPFGEIKLISSADSQAEPATSEALQTEVLSLREQIEALRKGRIGAGHGIPCGPGAPCASRLEQIEREHRDRLQELEREHERERREMQKERERLLQEEAQNASQAMEALRKAHQEQIERVRGGQQTDSTLQLPESVSLQQELEGLSERYSQRCVELSRVQHTAGHKHTLIEEKEREVQHLRKENQELQARLTEEMSLMRSFITGQKSGVVSIGSYEHSSSELEMLLRVKENEIEYLHKEVNCLRNEIQSLSKEKQELSERYKAVYVELSAVKGLSEREITSLTEHLRLTNAALEEEHLHGNSINQ